MPLPSLEPHPVDFWYGQLSDDAAESQQYLPLLDATELARAETLGNPLIKTRYIEVRGRLRRVLADKLKQHPASIRIERTEYGKPYLADHPQLVFSLSHTGNQFVIVAAPNCKLGVDIERIQIRANLAALVGRCFSDAERVYWQALPEAEKTPAFYEFWTKKEAFVKATGRGIALGLPQCVVDPQQPEVFLSLPEGYGPIEAWQAISLAIPTSNHPICAALVLDKPQVHIRHF